MTLIDRMQAEFGLPDIFAVVCLANYAIALSLHSYSSRVPLPERPLRLSIVAVRPFVDPIHLLGHEWSPLVSDIVHEFSPPAYRNHATNTSTRTIEIK